MATGIILLLMLVAILAAAAASHVMVWIRNTAAHEHFWFAVASLAAAGALAAYCVPHHGAPSDSPLLQQHVSVCFTFAWLIAVTWFTVEYSAGNVSRRWLPALVITLVFGSSLLGELALLATGSANFPVESQSFLGPSTVLAMFVLAGLIVEGAIRLWSSNEHYRAVVLGGGLGVALVPMTLHPQLLEQGLAGLPSPTPYLFLLAVGMMTYELARVVAEARTAAKQQRQGLMHASRLAIVGELTASIAHEINQPLGAILSNADAGEMLLERADPPLDEVRQILGDIRRDGLRASDVIRHVRTLVRNRELELEIIDANTVAADVIGLIAADAHRRRIPLASELLVTPASIRGDRTHLEQVLINLMLNAMDAVDTIDASETGFPAREPVFLGVSRTTHGDIEFRVVDAGPGIPVERLGQMFKSFHTSKPHGMGLGLSIARSIVEAHGGGIRVENNHGTGATFRVTLPQYSGQNA